jgi:hypothetical protein
MDRHRFRKPHLSIRWCIPPRSGDAITWSLTMTRPDGNQGPAQILSIYRKDAGQQDPLSRAPNMTHSEDAIDSKAHRLIEAVEQVGDDIWKIEVWAGALLGFASLAPVYEPCNWLHRLAPTGAPVPAE